MLSYNIYSSRTKACVTYAVDLEIPEIFNLELIELFNKRVSFLLGGEKLLEVKGRLKEIILSLLPKRYEDKGLIASNNIEGKVLDEVLLLNLRKEVDRKLFWFGNVYNLMEDAVIYNYSLKFIPNDGIKYVNNDINIDFEIC